jgi:hypothetical protein
MLKTFIIKINLTTSRYFWVLNKQEKRKLYENSYLLSKTIITLGTMSTFELENDLATMGCGKYLSPGVPGTGFSLLLLFYLQMKCHLVVMCQVPLFPVVHFLF